MAKKTTKPATKTQTTTPAAQSLPELLAQVRAAASLEDALTLLAPAPKVKTDPLYEVAEGCAAPLPQKRGLSVLVYVTAARLNRAFKAGDLVAALPEKKAVPYWVRRLAKSGHFRDVSTEVVR